MTHLFLCQIGPVQPFIAAGRRTQDLYVGSRILSQLARAGLSAVSEGEGFEPIFPMIYAGKLPTGIPHRFAFLCDEDPIVVGKVAEDAVRDMWRLGYAEKVYVGLRDWVGDGDWGTVFERQRDNWLEFYWVAVPYNQNEHSESFLTVSRAMAQRKLLRQFAQIEEGGRKCTLTGSQSALPLDWDKLKKRLSDKRDILFRPHEYLGTTALVKRLVQFTDADLGMDDKNFRPPSTSDIAGIGRDETEDKSKRGKQVEGYLAVLHMDGDGMGRNLSAIRELKLHQQFSQKLAEFADVHVPRIIQEYGGENATLVYAGGDDVLALLPLRNVLSCANELQKTFSSILEKAFPQLGKFTTSAGIAITPHDFPLDVALEMARNAEEIAKDNYRITPKQRGEMGYGAIVVTEAHSTGMIREAGGNWDVVPLMDALIGYFADDTLSGKLGYDILTIAHDMGGRVPADARQAELKRIIIRRLSEKIPTDDKKSFADDLANQISRLAEQKDANGNLRWQDMAHWTILARFIAKPPKQGAVI